ncbi:MAG: acyl carrier protein [Bacilli bacterium]|nr:acyl carrier protein [Bacilli bacterium]
MNEIRAKAEEVLAKKLKVKTVDPTKELRELGLDSLDIVEMLLALENEFHIQFNNDELKSLKKVQDLYAALEAKVAHNK